MGPTGPDIVQTMLALAAVLALIWGCAWVMRRIQRPGGAGSAAMNIRGQLAVGARERVVLIEVGDQWIVTGVAPGNVRALAVMPRPDDVPQSNEPIPPADFRTLLARLRKQP